MIDLWNLVRENELDPETNTAGTLGRVEFDPMEVTFRYAADTPELLALAPGETIVDYFTYTIHDVDVWGGRSTATVAVTVTGAGEASHAPNSASDPEATYLHLIVAYRLHVPKVRFCTDRT